MFRKKTENIYGIDIACQRTAYFLLPFPYAVRFIKVEEKITMKILKKLLLATAFVFCVSLSASAQTNEGKKTPPKEKPPVVVVKEKPKPKEDKPNDDNRVKKPQAFIFKAKNENEMSFV
jgi:hypothetical protein